MYPLIQNNLIYSFKITKIHLFEFTQIHPKRTSMICVKVCEPIF